MERLTTIVILHGKKIKDIIWDRSALYILYIMLQGNLIRRVCVGKKTRKEKISKSKERGETSEDSGSAFSAR